MKFKSIIVSVLSITCAACALTARADHTASADDLGKEINVDGTLTVSSTIDLQGKSITYKGVTGFSGAGGFTASSASTLELEVIQDATQTMAISGAISLIKSGSGKLTVLESDYTGTCEIKAGSIMPQSWGKKYKYYGSNPAVTVDAGATAYLNACYGFTTSHKFVLAGGTIEGGRNDTTESHVVCPKIELIANSRFAPSTSLTLGSEIQLGGYTLEVSAGGATTYWKPSLIADGIINVTKGTLTLKTDVGSPTASLTLGANTKIAGDYTYSVKDLVIDPTASVAGHIHVYGAYRLDEDGTVCDKVVMQGSSTTLDVSKVEGKVADITALQYADSVTVIVDVGERDFAEGDMVVSWTTKPEGVTFGLKGSVIGDNQNFAVTDTGLVYAPKSDEIASITWIGGSTGGWLDRANWSVKNGAGEEMEDVDTARLTAEAANLTATFSGDVSGLSFAGEFPFAGIEFLNAYLTADGDFTNIDWEKVVTTTPIDVKGKLLKISAAGSLIPPYQVEITDSVGEGVVEMTVPEDEVYRNEKMAFTGQVKIVKNGAGTFVGVLDLTNEGGFEVMEGKITPVAQGSLWVNNFLQTPFGKGVITIDEAGSLDPLGGYNWAGVTIELNGGMITNTVESLGVTSTRAAASRSNVFNPDIVLLKDSYFVTAESFNFQGAITANDHKLNLSIASSKRFVWYPSSAVNVYLNVVSGGWLQTMRDPIPATATAGMTLDMNAAPRFLEDGESHLGGMDVENYISRYGYSSSEGEAPLRVHGIFHPVSAYFYGATMMDGSTIDLSDQGTSWNIKSLKFEDGATITLDLSQRNLREGTRYVYWGTTPPTNLNTLHFKLDTATQSSGYTIEVEEDGIRAYKHVAYDLDVKNDTAMQTEINKFFNTTKNFDTTTTIINGWMETDAGNGYKLKDCLILGLPVVAKEKCAAPYLKADTSAPAEDGKIKFAFGGINNPMTDKADIDFEILTSTDASASEWDSEVSGKYDKDDPVADLPKPEAGQSAVKYFKVRFNISEKAK